MNATVTLTDVEVRAAVAAYVRTHHGYACTPESVTLLIDDRAPALLDRVSACIAVVKPDPPDKPAA